MFEVDVNGLTQQYRTKPTMNVDITGSSGSIPKPLTYDYMPEGYPSKSMGLVTLMEEQEVAFADNGDGSMIANSPVNLDIKLGDELTVIWDGVSYDAIVTTVQGMLTFGNLGMIGLGVTTDYPFLYVGQGPIGSPMFAAANTAASHTIKVMRQQATITPMSTDFIPKNLNVVFSGINNTPPDSCNVTYDELRGWIENGTPVFAIYKDKDDGGSVLSVRNIINFEINTDSLRVYYGSGANFKYNSDGTFAGSGAES